MSTLSPKNANSADKEEDGYTKYEDSKGECSLFYIEPIDLKFVRVWIRIGTKDKDQSYPLNSMLKPVEWDGRFSESSPRKTSLVVLLSHRDYIDARLKMHGFRPVSSMCSWF
jgi:hypothetical protein